MAKAKKVVKKKQRWLMLVVSFFVALLLSVFGGYFALLYAGEQMIDPTKLQDLKKDATVIYDKNNQPIGELHVAENRDYVPYSKIPKHVINAFVAVEDKRFFEHNGIDIIRIGGAILKDIKVGAAAEGGSTITQQLARNVFLSHEKTLWRKTKEMSIAINLENKYSKEEILEMYLNKIYMGEGVFGVEAASQLYFGKSVSELSLAEAASLAAIPKAPTHYSPFSANPAKAKERRDTILRLMYEQKYITLEQKEASQKEPMPEPKEQAPSGTNKGYRAYIDYVLREAEEKYGVQEEMLYRGGWKIYTAMDKQMQDAMIKAFANPKNFPKDGPKRPVQAGMVAVDPKTGGIAAMMGGRNYVPKGFNYATDGKRQPGSSFKPLVVFAPALDSGDWNIWSRLSNEKQSFNGYEPRNYNNKYSESVTMADALIQSLNVPAVWLLNEIGIGTGLEYAERFGIQLEPDDRNLAIALGGLNKGTSPLNMAQAFTAIANGGQMAQAHAIVKMEEPQIGYVDTVKLEHASVLKPQTAWDLHTMLEWAVERGTGKAARMDRPVAGKTGTTQSEISNSSRDNKDAWFVGYTPEYVGAVWMGFDVEDKQHVLRNGSDIPAKLFRTVFQEGLKGRKVTSFVRPDGVEDPTKKKEEEQAEPLQLAADLTLDGGQLTAVLTWIGANEANSFDLYRYVDSPDDKELIAAGLTDMHYVDSITEPQLYKYQVVARDAQGQEVAVSNVAEISVQMLENLLRDGLQHDDTIPPEGELPPEGENGSEDPAWPGEGEVPPDPQNPGSSHGGVPPGSVTPPPDIPTGGIPGVPPGVQLPPPPEDEGEGGDGNQEDESGE